MQMLAVRTLFSHLTLAGGLCLLIAAAPVFAQTSIITSGDICAPVNVGKAIRTIQNFRGTIVNISEDESIAVSCPMTTDVFAATAFIRISATNGSDEAQEFRCVLREIDSQENVVTQFSRTLEIPPGATDRPFVEQVEILAPFNRFNLTCTLPPQGSIGLIAIDTFN